MTIARYHTPSGRLIQRDYSDGSFYNYITRGGSNRFDERGKSRPSQPSGSESKTDTGRVVFGGNGITPDVLVKPRALTSSRLQLLDAIFFFTRELVNGRIAGFDSYRWQGPADFSYKLQDTDLPANEALFQAFKSFVSRDPSWKPLLNKFDLNHDFIDSYLRYSSVMAAHGPDIAERVLVSSDPQVAQALELLPRARELYLSSPGANPKHGH